MGRIPPIDHPTNCDSSGSLPGTVIRRGASALPQRARAGAPAQACSLGRARGRAALVLAEPVVGPGRRRRARCRAHVARHVRLPGLPDVASRRPVAAVRRRARRHGARRQERRRPADAVPRRLGRDQRPRTSAACSRSRSRPTTRSRASSTRSRTLPNGTLVRLGVPCRAGRGRRRRRPPHRPEHPPQRHEPQRRASSSSGPTATSTSASATAAARPARTARTPASCSARSCASIRAPTFHGARTRSRPASRSRRARARDLRLRPAQPVALLVRRPHRRPHDRRRRRQQLGGDRPAPGGLGAGRELRLELLGGHAPARPGRLHRPGALPPIYEYAHDATHCSISGGFVARDPTVPTLAGRYLFADYCGTGVSALLLPVGATADIAHARRAPQLVGFGRTPTATSTSRRSRAGSGASPARAPPTSRRSPRSRSRA